MPLDNRRQPTYRVLVAEDGYAWRVTIVRLVEALGVACVGVEDGLDAAALLEDVAQPFHLAITDFRMPRGSGWRVVEAAQNIAARPSPSSCSLPSPSTPTSTCERRSLACRSSRRTTSTHSSSPPFVRRCAFRQVRRWIMAGRASATVSAGYKVSQGVRRARGNVTFWGTDAGRRWEALIVAAVPFTARPRLSYLGVWTPRRPNRECGACWPRP